MRSTLLMIVARAVSYFALAFCQVWSMVVGSSAAVAASAAACANALGYHVATNNVAISKDAGCTSLAFAMIPLVVAAVQLVVSRTNDARTAGWSCFYGTAS